MRSFLRGGAFAGSLTLGAGLLLAPTASAGVQAPEACPPDVWYKVVAYPATHEGIGSTAGKRNAGSASAILRYDMSTTTAKQSTWTDELGGSINFAIAEVTAKTSHEITKSTTKGVTVSNTMNVPGRQYGYTTPKIERRTFIVEKWQDTSTCGARKLGNMGKLWAITAYPFFSECVATGPCTPKP
ncbi:hypothetical protein ACGFYZ_25230 [Streptomyces sp. NPDC048330]|uniref:hypothetical protein n=1 Tax=Streptomyces sp. NPDC048330 TaxID=3365533 RepID=UPI00371685F8